MYPIRGSTSALVVIDVQNEFFDTRGNFPIHPSCRDRVITNLKTLIPKFREKVGHVIWVKAHYIDRDSEPPAMAAQNKGDGAVGRIEWLAVATHVCPISCCKIGTFGGQMYGEVFELFDESDDVVVKGGYSSFSSGDGKSDFEATLKRRGVEEIYLCGTASGTCVLATAVVAVGVEGLKVNVVHDCCGWRRENTHVEAMERFKGLGLALFTSDEIPGIGDVDDSIGDGEEGSEQGSVGTKFDTFSSDGTEVLE